MTLNKDNRYQGPGIAMWAAIGAGIGAGITTCIVPAVVAALGFTSQGITNGSLAASMMAAEATAGGGGIASGGMVATLQSAGAVGFRIGTIVGVATFGALIGLALTFTAFVVFNCLIANAKTQKASNNACYKSV